MAALMRAALIALMGCALPTAAGAWSVRPCGGQSSRWVSAEPVQMELESRWGEVGTSWGDALRRGMLAWNDGGAARRMFRWRDRRMDRVVHGNGRNEITVVAPASIDNVLGLTHVRRWIGFMLSPTGRADSNLGNNLSYSAKRLIRWPDGECR